MRHPALAPPLPLGSPSSQHLARGFPSFPKRPGLVEDSGNPWSLRAPGFCDGSRVGVRKWEASPGDRLNWSPQSGLRCHVVTFQVSQVWVWRASNYPPAVTGTERLRGEWEVWGGGLLIPAPAPSCTHSPPTRGRGCTQPGRAEGVWRGAGARRLVSALGCWGPPSRGAF